MGDVNEPLLLAGGVRSLAMSLRKVADTELSKQMRLVNKKAADEIVPIAKRMVPVRSGKLRGSIGSQATRTTARVKAGSKARVPYARRIHSGYFHQTTGRRVKGRPFIKDAIPVAWPKIRKEYIKGMNKVSSDFRKKHGGHIAVGRFR